MFFTDKNVVLNKIMNDIPISNTWVLDPNDIKGTLHQINNGRGYLIFRQINSGMKIEDITKEGLIFIDLENDVKVNR